MDNCASWPIRSDWARKVEFQAEGKKGSYSNAQYGINNVFLNHVHVV